MNTEFTFFVQGHPVPGGSKNFFPIWRKDENGKHQLVIRYQGDPPRPWPVINVSDSSGEGNKAWRQIVATTARQKMGGATRFFCPVKVSFTFYMRRPKSHYRTGKFAGVLRGDAPIHHIQMPDALKLARSTEDALTGIVWEDDAQNVIMRSEKRWCAPGETEGCAVRVVAIVSPELPTLG